MTATQRRRLGISQRNGPHWLLIATLFSVHLAAGRYSHDRALADTAAAAAPQVYRLTPSDTLQFDLQETLILASPGDVIEFSRGTFELSRQVDIAIDHLTLRGQGSDETVLSFKGQRSGGQGIESTGNHFVMEGIAVEDTAGNAIKVLGSRNVTFRDVRTEWTGDAKSTNGAYGLYPVQCSNVLIDSCIAIGASDAGIYVGQSRGVIVRNCRAERNVAGIEIENTIDASVYDNVATDNAGGLLVFDLPGLQQKAGRNVRLFRNKVVSNNHVNFAAPGNIVASVPSGTGLMIMATDHVEAFDNDFKDNQTANVSIVSYLVSGKRIKDETYDPISEAISIHDNRFSGGGDRPGGPFGEMLSFLGTPLPDILFDGVFNPKLLVDGKLPADLQHSIVDNGDATFIDFQLPALNAENIKAGTYKPSTDLSPYAAARAPIAETVLAEHDRPSGAADAKVIAYRAAPKKLSEYGLFLGIGATQQPAPNVVPYELNTALFTDHASKLRFIRIPEGTQIEYAEEGVLEFPDGTVIAKTFAYPFDRRDLSKGQRLIETRIETLQDGDWYGYSYRWNDDQTDATLLLGGGEVDVSWIHDDGTKRSNQYLIPNANQCLNCHSQDNAYVPIGPTAMNMNRDHEFAGGMANQLDFLADSDQLANLPEPFQRESMPVASDPDTATLTQRARAWLDVNCAHCHSPRGTARTSGLDLRFSQHDPKKFGLWKSPVAAGHGTGGRPYDIVPGKPDQSILLYRMQSRDPSVRMPNVGRNMVPTEGVELIMQWIAEMPNED